MQKSLLFMLFMLYAIQGIPYGIQSRFLPVYLRSKSYSLTILGLLKLLYIPWILKSLYAPIIDLKWTRFYWLSLSIMLLSINSLLLSVIAVTDTAKLLSLLFMYNFLCASQDIALDGIMIAKLKSKDLSVGNIAQVVGYKFGAIFGGGVLLYLSYYLSWSYIFKTVSSIYLTSFILLSIYSNKLTERRKEKVEFKCHLNTFFKTIQTRSTLTMILLVVMYKLGEQGAMSLLPLYLYDMKYSLKTIGFWTGIVGQVISIIGSSLAPILTSKKGLSGTLILLSITSIPLHAFLLYMVSYGTGYNATFFNCAIVLMSLLLMVSGLRTTTMFSLMMQCSQTVPVSIQTSYYTLLATTEVFGKLMFSSFIGAFADKFGYQMSYFVFLLLSITLTLYLLVIRPVIDSIENTAMHEVKET